ncbi:MAG: carbohydrate kinase family protein [Bacteroidota bacterium]
MIAAFGEILYDVFPDRELLGGAPFNFLYHVHALTGNGTIISRIGNDDRGSKIREFLNRHSIDQQNIQIDLHHPTGTAVVQLTGEGIPSFTITEDSAYDFIEHTPEADAVLAQCDMLYYGTLAQRNEMSRSSLYALTQNADRCFFDVNLRQDYYSTEVLQRSLVLADIVKLNGEELETIHSLFFSTPYTLAGSASELMENFSLSHLAVTLGENGSWIYTPGSNDFRRTTVPHVRDTVGAGDAFAAMMCLGIMRGWSIAQLHERASAFSAAICGIDGALPDGDDFYEQYRKHF